MPFETTTADPVAITASTTPRFDLYADIHKALRAAMGDTLSRVGRTDANDVDDLHTTLASVRDLLAMCASHVDKENRYLHPAIEARAAGASGRIAAEHDDHLQAIADLDEHVQGVESAPLRTREAALTRLHHRLSCFVAENFEHMVVEETAHNAALWAAYDDDELRAIHGRILASIAPAEMTQVLRWMVPAITPTARAHLFAGLRASLPPEAFDGTLGFVKRHLDDRDARRLDNALRAMAH